MKNKYLPFQIGQEYENWEFALEFSDEEKIKGFDSYFIFGKLYFLLLFQNTWNLYFVLIF